MNHLLSNALTFTPSGGSVRVRARVVRSAEQQRTDPELRTENSDSDRDFMEISVADTGIGIKREDFSRLFRDFAQLEAPITKKYPGAGLGLSLTRKLVELHGGRIWAESEFGKGSTFTFILPLKQTNEMKTGTIK